MTVFTLPPTEEVEDAGIDPHRLLELARRGQIERRARALYRLPLIPPTPLDAYREATLWPRGFEKGENERFRDLIDLIICRDLVANLGEVREACIDTFEARNLHAWPPTLQVPDSWAEPYAALAEEMDFPVTDVGDAAAQAREFISKIDAR